MKNLETYVQKNQELFRSITLEKAKDSVNGALFAKGRWPEIFPIAAERYVLIWSPSCPRAQRVMICLQMLGLDRVIETVALLPDKTSRGAWQLPEEHPFDRNISLLNELAPESFVQPVLFDKLTKQIVTDDQYNLSRYFAWDWQDFHAAAADQYYPHEQALAIETWNGFIFLHVNQRIYQAAYAKTREQFYIYSEDYYQALQFLDEHLASREYLLGEKMLEPDLRLFPNLLRYAFYYHQFGLNKYWIEDFPHLVRYARAIYQRPAVKNTTYLEELLQTHYFSPDNVKKFGTDNQKETIASTFGWLIKERAE